MNEPNELVTLAEGELIENFIENARVKGGSRLSLAVWNSRKKLLNAYWDH